MRQISEQPGEDLGAIYVLGDSVIAKERSANRLNKLSLQRTSCDLSKQEYESALRKGIQAAKCSMLDAMSG
jgi:hypothetical protein